MTWIAYKQTVREILEGADKGKTVTTTWYYDGSGWVSDRSEGKEYDTEEEAANVDDADGAEQK